MALFSVKNIPNTLTITRMVLALPIFILIILENYTGVLWIVFVAGITDALDGFIARKFNAQSRLGSILDPISDKVLMITSFLAFAIVGTIPWWVAALVILRDVVIISGATAYHHIIGRYDMAPTVFGKVSTFIQIAFILFLIAREVFPVFPDVALPIGVWLVVIMVFVSGGNYVFVWAMKAIHRSSSKKQMDEN